ncbi:MAG: hypothetical protein KF718_01930 [Polyangiaceae bacterium]|nr:hypothetical protein [Polyangiaceae bacterium]
MDQVDAHCDARAVLIVTKQFEGTASNVAKNRVDLVCGLPSGHDGDHRDAAHGESWEHPADRVFTILRHEDEV